MDLELFSGIFVWVGMKTRQVFYKLIGNPKTKEELYGDKHNEGADEHVDKVTNGCLNRVIGLLVCFLLLIAIAYILGIFFS